MRRTSSVVQADYSAGAQENHPLLRYITYDNIGYGLHLLGNIYHLVYLYKPLFAVLARRIVAGPAVVATNALKIAASPAVTDAHLAVVA